MLPPFPIEPAPVPFPCQSAGYAIAALQLARNLCLRATYIPSGGTDCKRDTPVTHTLWVMGDKKQVERFRLELYLQSDTRHK